MKKKISQFNWLATQALHQCFLLSKSLLQMQQQYYAYFLFCHIELKEYVNQCLRFNTIKFSLFIKDLRETGFFFLVVSMYSCNTVNCPKNLVLTASICAKMLLFCIISAHMIREERQIASQYFYENIFLLMEPPSLLGSWGNTQGSINHSWRFASIEERFNSQKT